MSICSTERAQADHMIGPNAVTRMAQALSIRLGEDLCEDIFVSAGLEAYLKEPPTRMIPALDVATLHRETFSRLGEALAASIGRDAGRLTGDYLLTNRIPHLVQRLLKRLPRRLAARIFLALIARHAWTFVGGGDFTYDFAQCLRLRIEGAPISRDLRTETPACAYYAATFERLFSEMLGPTVRITEIECEATGDAACVFEVVW